MSAQKPTSSDHASSGSPTVLSAPFVRAGPSVPIVSHESNWASGSNGRNATSTGPMSDPNGGPTWNAGGISSGAPGSPYSA